MSKRQLIDPVVEDDIEVPEVRPRRWPIRVTENIMALTVLGVMAKDGVTWLELVALFAVLGTMIWRGRKAKRRSRGGPPTPRPPSEVEGLDERSP